MGIVRQSIAAIRDQIPTIRHIEPLGHGLGHVNPECQECGKPVEEMERIFSIEIANGYKEVFCGEHEDEYDERCREVIRNR